MSNTIDAMKQADTALASVEAVSIDTIRAARGSLREAIAREEAQTVAVPSGAREALIAMLRGGRQCDETGEEIIMSRQACCDAADMLAADGASSAVPTTDFTVLQRFADYRCLSYNELCTVVTEAVSTPKPPAKPPLKNARILSIWRSLSNRDVYTFSRAIEKHHGITGEPT